MTQPDADEVRRLARMVAGRELDAAMNVAELDERFPDPKVRDAVIAEVMRIAARLIRTGSHPEPTA
ncbi:hypothetical protein [Streptomyces sp. NPDC006267]|uniref:hypothetical protein n=1 Tax=Streptomyces sp. NPDC006267 TaxID=3157173 RepID=UPI0033BC59E2